MKCIIHNLSTIDSTHSYAKSHRHSFDPDMLTIVQAEKQTAGKGRVNKTWFSPEGKNIYASFFFTLAKTSKDIICLSHLMALSCCSVLSSYGFKPKIKWPNDIFLQEKKVAGILCETIFEKMISVILGIGMNVNMDREDLTKIDQKATSLKIEKKTFFDRKVLLDNLINVFSHELLLFKKKGFFPFYEKYNRLALYKGEKVSILVGEKKYTGIYHSIAKDGMLNLILEDHSLKSFTSGSLSV